MPKDEIEKIIKELEKKAEKAQEKPTKTKEEPKTHPQPSHKHKTIFKSFFFYLVCFVAFFFIAYFGLNAKSYSIKTKYTYQTKIQKKPYTGGSTLPNVPIQNEINLPDSILIPKINVNAPIIWQIKDEEINNKLNDGVIHFAGSALPNENGTIALTAHSSTYPWNKSPYGQIFALLDNLQKNDEVNIIYQKRKYVYKVTDKKIINPENIEILKTNDARLLLITCWPIGTALKREVIYADRIEMPPPSRELLLPNGL